MYFKTISSKIVLSWAKHLGKTKQVTHSCGAYTTHNTLLKRTNHENHPCSIILQYGVHIRRNAISQISLNHVHFIFSPGRRPTGSTVSQDIFNKEIKTRRRNGIRFIIVLTIALVLSGTAVVLSAVHGSNPTLHSRGTNHKLSL